MILKGTNPYHYVFGEIDGEEGFYHIIGNRPLTEKEIEETERVCNQLIEREVESITDEINTRILKSVLKNGFPSNRKMGRK